MISNDLIKTPYVLVGIMIALMYFGGCKNDGKISDSNAADRLDNDRDGYVENNDGAINDEGAHIPGGDCNDRDALINPASAELCDAIDNDCDSLIDEGAWNANLYYYDADRDGFGDSFVTASECSQPDGYVLRAGDCDDKNNLVNPDGVEVCTADGESLSDEDCDGNFDEGTAIGAIIWFADEDGDGHGTPWDMLVGCEQFSGYVSLGDDCDDTRADINPDMVELCDNYVDDEDCDNLYDDQDDNVQGQIDWFADVDGDQYGDANDVHTLCAQPNGYVVLDTDCNDTDDLINPGNAEICGNNTDDDCDGDIDEESAPGGAYVRWYEDDDGDGYGDPASSTVLMQCGQPSGYALLAIDCDDTDINIYPDAVEIWYDGIDEDCDGWSDYDADFDGYDSLAYTGDDCDDNEFAANPGLPEICGDNIDNNCDNLVDTCEVDAAFLGDIAGDQLGYSVSTAGDWDGDGDDDILVGAYLYAGGGNARGGVYVIPGDPSISGTNTASTWINGADPGAVFSGANDQDHLGWALASLGDVDDDGYDDILMSAPDEDSGGKSAGMVYLHYGPEYTAVDLATGSDFQFTGEAPGDQAGYAMANAGDVDGDGNVDMLISAPFHSNSAAAAKEGTAYLVLGPVSGAGLDLSFADTRYYGLTGGEELGWSVAGGGDLDADGLDELVVGAPLLEEAGIGTVGGAYIFDYTASFSASTLDAEGRMTGVVVNERAGFSVAIPGDVDGDGYDDVLVGAPESSVSGAQTGVTYLVLGPVSGDVNLRNADATFVGDDEYAYVGNAVAGPGDLDGNGYDDILIGARTDDFVDSDTGGAYVVLSPVVGTFELFHAQGKVVGNNPLIVKEGGKPMRCRREYRTGEEPDSSIIADRFAQGRLEDLTVQRMGRSATDVR